MVVLLFGPLLILGAIMILILGPLFILMVFALPLRYIVDNYNNPLLVVAGLVWFLSLVAIAVWGIFILQPEPNPSHHAGPSIKYCLALGYCDPDIEELFTKDFGEIRNSIYQEKGWLNVAQSSTGRFKYPDDMPSLRFRNAALKVRYATFINTYKKSRQLVFTDEGRKNIDSVELSYKEYGEQFQDVENGQGPCPVLIFLRCSL